MTVAYTEFRFDSAAPLQSHSYLLPAVQAALGEFDSSGRMLDVGCGTGAITARLRAPGREVYGCDASESGTLHAVATLGADRVRRTHADADLRELFPGIDAWDVLVSCEVVEHLYDPRAFARACFQGLRSGGSLVITTPYHGRAKWLALALAGHVDQHVNPLWDCGHIKFWSRDTLTKLLEEAGFRVVSFRGAGRAPYLWKSMVLRAVKP